MDKKKDDKKGMLTLISDNKNVQPPEPTSELEEMLDVESPEGEKYNVATMLVKALAKFPSIDDKKKALIWKMLKANMSYKKISETKGIEVSDKTVARFDREIVQVYGEFARIKYATYADYIKNCIHDADLPEISEKHTMLFYIHTSRELARMALEKAQRGDRDMSMRSASEVIRQCTMNAKDAIAVLRELGLNTEDEFEGDITLTDEEQQELLDILGNDIKKQA